MKLSKRLELVAKMVSPGGVIADIGTDHGYVPIYLIENNKCDRVFAADINKGPLERADAHIRECGLSDKIETVLSDGMVKLQGKNINKVIVAGMGGELICKIIDSSPIIEEIDEMVLSPHSDIYKVRKCILEKGFCIIDERMVKDAGKYYIVIKCIRTDSKESFQHGCGYDEFELTYGRMLFENKDEVFFEYLNNKIDKYNSIMQGLGDSDSARAKYEELSRKSEQCKIAIEKMKE
ncbi:MAG: class I SAM-dependent methyltransferase [Lachnospiraceae bacterium]|nr:class I SAM-dependent methyltransferase [Lachnospiraceae bacterium]